MRIEADEVSLKLRKLEFSHAFASGTRLVGRWSFRQWKRKGEEIFQREMIVAANQSLPISLAQLFSAPKPTFRFTDFRIEFTSWQEGNSKANQNEVVSSLLIIPMMLTL